MTTPYPVWPVQSGSSRRTWSLINEMQKQGIEITLLSPDRKPIEMGFNWLTYSHLGKASYFFNPFFKLAVKKALKEKFNAVWVQYPYQAKMIIPSCQRLKIPVLYDAHNMEAIRFKRNQHSKTTVSLIQNLERYLINHSKTVLTVTKEEQKICKKLYHRQSILVPNAIDPVCFYKKTNYSKNTILLFGAYDYQPNRDALDFILNQVWAEVSHSHPRAELHLAGRNTPPNIKQNNVVIHGHTPDIAKLIQEASFTLCPINQGGGSQLKILESLACGKRVLCTPFSAKPYPQIPETDILELVPNKWVARILTLLREPNPITDSYPIQKTWEDSLAEIPWGTFH